MNRSAKESSVSRRIKKLTGKSNPLEARKEVESTKRFLKNGQFPSKIITPIRKAPNNTGGEESWK